MGYCGFELRYAAFLKERHAPVDDSLVIVPQGRIILLIVYLLKSDFGKRRKLYTDARKGGLTPELRPMITIMFLGILALLIIINLRKARAAEKAK